LSFPSSTAVGSTSGQLDTPKTSRNLSLLRIPTSPKPVYTFSCCEGETGCALATPVSMGSWFKGIEMNLTPLGIVHTILSLTAVASMLTALLRDRQISPSSRIGRIYIWSLIATCATGLLIFRHGTVGPPHVLGVLTLVVFGVAAIAGRHLFGRYSAYIKTISYSATVLFLMISTVTETFTRIPPSAPIVARPDAPVFRLIYLALLALFLVGVTSQVRRLRAASSP